MLGKHQAVGVNRRARSLICRISPKPSHSVQIKPSNILLALNWHQAGLAKLGSSYGQHARCQVNIDISQSERFSYAQSG